MSALARLVRDTLAQEPGLRAKDLARRFGSTSREVNAILYGELAAEVIQDRDYTWRLRKQQGAAPPLQETGAPAHELARLAGYFLDCISHDDMGGVSVFAASKFGDPQYVEIRLLPRVDAPSSEWFSDPQVQRLFQKAKAFGKRDVVVLGYPVYLHFLRSRKGWEGYKVEPLFLFQFAESSTAGVPVLGNDLP